MANLFAIPLTSGRCSLRDISTNVHSADQSLVEAFFDGSAKPGAEQEVVFRVLDGGKTVRHVLIRGRRLARADDPLVLTGVALDVTPIDAARAKIQSMQALSAALAHATTARDVVVAVSDHLPVAGLVSLQLGVVDEPAGVLTIHSVDTGPEAVLSTDSVALSKSSPLARAALTDPSPESIDDDLARGTVANLAWASQPEGSSILTIPLAVSGRRLGALGLTFVGDRDGDLRSHTGDFGTLATWCAETLSRTLLFQQQADVAGVLQEHFLPEALPTVDGFEMHGQFLPGACGVGVGGDWYDVVPIEGGDVVVVLGDAIGKGAGAARLMARMRHTMRAYINLDSRPASVLARSAALAHRWLADDEIVTVFYAVLSPDTGRLRYASAGHLPPLLVGDGGVQDLDVDPAPPLGAGGNWDFIEQEVQLAEGEIVLMYSDGLVERQGGDLDVGLDALRGRLREVQSSDGDLDRICRAVLSDLPHPLPDDVSVLLVRRTPAGVG